MNNYKNLFNSSTNKPSSDLYDKVLNRIAQEKNILIIKKRLIISSITFSISFVCFISSIFAFISAASASGFSEFFALIFSDFGTILSYWQNFALSLLETAPIINFILFLVVSIFTIFLSRFLTKDIKNFINYSHIKI